MRKFGVLMLVMMLLSVTSASADKLQKQMRYQLENYCTFVLNDVKSYDVFFNQESGEAKDFIVVSFTLQNLKTEDFFLKAETGAKIVYEGDFEFEPQYLWPNPEGTYFCVGPNLDESYLWITYMDDTGRLLASSVTYSTTGLTAYNDYANRLERTSSDFVEVYIIQSFSGYRNYMFIYSPIDDGFHGTEYLSEHTYISKDTSKTVLAPVVERTYNYVFKVPDMVAGDEGNRELIFTVGNDEFTLRF